MIRALHNLPIRQKLTLICMITSAAALVLASAGFIAYDQYSSRRSMVRDLAITAEMIGFSSTSALTFDDDASARETLQSLAAQPHIVSAAIYDRDGEVFATFQAAPEASPLVIEPAPPDALDRFGSGRLDLFRPIIFNGETIGMIHLRSNLGVLDERLQSYGLIVGAVMVLSLLIAYLIASRLRQVIANPLYQLAGIARRVTTENNYSLRAAKRGDDELGQLIDVFNNMLAQIQSRDSELQAAHSDLEQRVRQRTADLSRSEERFRALSSSSPIGIFQSDLNGQSIYTNRRWQEITGLTADESMGEGWTRAIHPDDRGNVFAEWTSAAAAMREFSLEYRVLTPQQQLRWVHARSKALLDKDGHTSGYVGSVEDITDRKSAEIELMQVHQQLVAASRQAGMAEVATGVLHNVGNVLNSVNVSATLVTDQLRHSKVVNLGKLCALLDQHPTDLGAYVTEDPKGKMIPGYLATLNESLTGEQQAALEELESLRKNIEHIKDIVAMQQSYAKTSGVTETVSVPDLVEDALRMNAGSLQRHDIDLVREYLARPVITLDKHKVLQILVNLVRNAKYACDESGRLDKVITMRVTADNRFVSIAVTDNGVGIAPENLTRIFAHGFTTRESGHGFGLHSGALAAKELGGSLTPHSAGPGEGATFTLKLPYAQGTSSHV